MEDLGKTFCYHYSHQPDLDLRISKVTLYFYRLHDSILQKKIICHRHFCRILHVTRYHRATNSMNYMGKRELSR